MCITAKVRASSVSQRSPSPPVAPVAQILYYTSADPTVFCHQRAQSPFAWPNTCAICSASGSAQVRRAGGTAGEMETGASHESGRAMQNPTPRTSLQNAEH